MNCGRKPKIIPEAILKKVPNGIPKKNHEGILEEIPKETSERDSETKPRKHFWRDPR